MSAVAEIAAFRISLGKWGGRGRESSAVPRPALQLGWKTCGNSGALYSSRGPAPIATEVLAHQNLPPCSPAFVWSSSARDRGANFPSPLHVIYKFTQWDFGEINRDVLLGWGMLCKAQWFPPLR